MIMVMIGQILHHVSADLVVVFNVLVIVDTV